MKLKQELRNVLCACVATIPLQLGAPDAFAEAEDLTIIPQGETKSVTAHSVCQVISNGGGADIMAPHRKSNEWAVGGNSFLFNTAGMDGVSVSECGDPAVLVPDEAPFAYIRQYAAKILQKRREKAMWNNLSGFTDISGDFDDIVSRYPYCLDQDGGEMSYTFNIYDIGVSPGPLMMILVDDFDKDLKSDFTKSLKSFYDKYKGQAYIPEGEDACNITANFSGITAMWGGGIIPSVSFGIASFDYLYTIEREDQS
jgi:hypothetical protein